MGEPRRIVDFVAQWAERQPERVCLTFHQRTGPPISVTYGALWEDTLACARGLRRLMLDPGAPVVVLAHSSRPFVSTFLAVQHAGLLAVPCPPPEPLESGRSARQRVAHIIERSQATVLLDPDPGPGTGPLRDELAPRGVSVLDPSTLREAGSAAAPESGPDCPFAYCQFTSGSGGRAKGVRLTHENLLAFMRARTAAYGLGPADVGVSWLPLFHDMGLIGYVLHPLVNGLPVHLMPTAAFLARPGAWPALISSRPGNPLGRPQLGLRAVRAQGLGRGAGRARPVLLAHGLQRLGARDPRRDRRVRASVRPRRIPGVGHAGGVRPGREHAYGVLAASRRGDALRGRGPGYPRAGSCGPPGRGRRGASDDGLRGPAAGRAGDRDRRRRRRAASAASCR